jgi:hypothetical protein
MWHIDCYKSGVEVDSRKDEFMMKRLILVLGSVALLAVFSFAADQPSPSGCRMMGGMGGGGRMMGGMHGMMGGGGGMMRGMGGMGCSFDFSKTVSLDGTVDSVAMAQGQGFPHFVLVLADGTKVTIVTAPFRAVLDANYTIAKGNQMSVVAFPSTQSDTFRAAVLTNASNGNAVLNLRDASGAPVTAGRGNGTCGNCPNR